MARSPNKRRHVKPDGGYVAVRLEGGLGDHVLGMRVLPFLSRRHPDRRVVLLSDCAAQPAQIAVAGLVPGAPEVIPVFRRPDLQITLDQLGRLELLDEHAVALIDGADLFIDTFGETMLVEAARILDCPLFEMLATRPILEVPAWAVAEADEVLRRTGGERVVAMNLTKHGTLFLRYVSPLIDAFVDAFLARPGTVILNLLTAGYDFQHASEPTRTARRRTAANEYDYLRAYRQAEPRIVPCVDLPIATVVALLKRCRYFVGVDNGVKHLAWACGVPLTCLFPRALNLSHVLRWMPDVNHVLLCSCDTRELSRHVSRAIDAL